MKNAKLLLTPILIFLTASFVIGQPGSLDSTFGNGGTIVVNNLILEAHLVKTALQSDGKIVVVGTNNAKIIVFRFNADGSTDATFGTNGSTTFEFSIGRACYAGAVTIQPDGKILVGGQTAPNNPSTLILASFAVASLNPNGSLDTSFGGGTGMYIGDGGGSAPVRQIALQPDGKIIFTGPLTVRRGPGYYDGPGHIAVRLQSNGVIDNSFGSNGTALAPLDANGSSPCIGGGTCTETAHNLVLQPDGKIVVIGGGNYIGSNGTTIQQTTAQHIVRFLSNGQLDSSFGNGGRIWTLSNRSPNPPAEIFGFGAVAIQPDGKIVLAGGGTPPDGTSSFAAFRYTANGALDASFDGDGKVFFPIEPSANFASVVLVQPNGKIVLAGQAAGSASPNSNFALARLNTDGSLDNSFDTDGKVTTDFGSTSNDSITSAVLQPDGKILVAGLTNYDPSNGTFKLALARYTGDASVTRRPSFDFDGDGKSDVAVFRPSNGFWYLLNSTSGFTGRQFGAAGDKIAPADYDGDGKTDIAVFREGAFGYFYIFSSADSTFRFAQFGTTGDVPVGSDWDGDGKADLAVYRAGASAQAASNFYYRPSGTAGADFITVNWGAGGDRPVVGDYDGDGKADAAVFRPANATWYVRKSSDNSLSATTFGLASDIPTPADFDGDGDTDVAVFRPSSGTWFTSQNPATNYGAIVFGAAGDLPVAADYDGDGKADAAVFRPSNGGWFLNRTTSGLSGVQFGANGDKPVSSAFVP